MRTPVGLGKTKYISTALDTRSCIINEMNQPTPKRLAKIKAVASKRTRNLVIVMEQIGDVGNINACMRSCEAMGVLDLHIIEHPDTFYKKGKRTSSGAAKWLNVHKWPTIEECLGHLKSSGFQVAVTTLGEGSVAITSVDYTLPTAIVMGNESTGASTAATALADIKVFIPMHGFVESYNISVACALSLYTAMLQRGDSHHDQTPAQIEELVQDYIKR